MSNIDFNQIIENLSDERVIQLVTELGSDEYIEKSDCIIFKTICHNENAEDASMKLYYYKKNKRFVCYTECGCSFNIFTLFEKRYNLLGLNFNYYRDIILKIAGNNISFQNNDNGFIKKYKSEYNKYNINKIQVDLKIYDSSILNTFTFFPTPEWLNDGIGIEAMKNHNILYSIEQNKIIIPHYDINDNLIGIRGRALNEEDIELGKYMPIQANNQFYSHPLAYNLYGLNKVKNNIKKYKMAIVAEAEKSVLQYETMVGQDKNIVTACCGSNLHKYQVELLLSCGAERILIAFDKEWSNNKEKEKYFLKLKSICNRYKNVCRMGFIFDFKNLLELKDSPFDKGYDICKNLIKQGVWI